MACCGNSTYIQQSGVVGTAVINLSDCKAVTVDLLQMYKNPIDCILAQGLWDLVEISQADLIASSMMLGNYIAAKTYDANDCTYYDQLNIVKHQMKIIFDKHVCI